MKQNRMITFSLILLVMLSSQMGYGGTVSIRKTLYDHKTEWAASVEDFALEGDPRDVPFEIFENLKHAGLRMSDWARMGLRVGTVQTKEEWDPLWKNMGAETGFYLLQPSLEELRKTEKASFRSMGASEERIAEVDKEKVNELPFPEIDFDKNSLIWYSLKDTLGSGFKLVGMKEYENALLITLDVSLTDYGNSDVVLWKIPKTNKPILFEETVTEDTHRY